MKKRKTQQVNTGLKMWSVAWLLALAAWMAGCGSGAVEQQRAQQAQEFARLQEENKEVQKLRAENKELPRLRRENEELPKLRGYTDEIEKLRTDNERIKSEITNSVKLRNQRQQAEQQARQAAALAASKGMDSRLRGSLALTNAADPYVPQDGDEIFIDPKFLAKIMPQFDWSKLERKEPIAVKALLEQQGFVLTNYQQLISLGITNYVIQHGPPKLPAAAPAPPPQ